MDPLTQSLLLKMRHNRVYTAATLARLFGVSEKAVEAALSALVRNGKARACNNARRDVGYCLAGVAPTPAAARAAAAQNDPPTVATPPVLRRVDGVLAGYDGQLAALRSLAMLARR